MNRLGSALARVFDFLPRLAILSVLLAAPVIAVPMVDSNNGERIEAPAQKKSGMGLVILVSLQRG